MTDPAHAPKATETLSGREAAIFANASQIAEARHRASRHHQAQVLRHIVVGFVRYIRARMVWPVRTTRRPAQSGGHTPR